MRVDILVPSMEMAKVKRGVREGEKGSKKTTVKEKEGTERKNARGQEREGVSYSRQPVLSYFIVISNKCI